MPYIMQLTLAQRIFVVSTWISSKSIQRVQELFSIRFPERRQPSKNTIWKNVRKYQENGTSHNLNKGRSGRKRTSRSEENIENVRILLQENPNVSIRRNGLPLSRSTFNRIILHDLHWHPYKIHSRQHLMETDYARRREYAAWLLSKPVRFLDRVVIGDEAAFFMNGKVNSQNTRMYSEKGNPPEFNYEVPFCREKLSVWIGICGNGSIIGPFFYENTMTGAKYLDLINDSILPELQRIYGNNFNRLWWFQDGAPAHRVIIVRERLQELFGTRIVSLNHEVEWPPRSPDLTPCDYFLWGYLKNQVYSTPPENIGQLQERITRKASELKENPEMVRKVVLAMRSRAQLCFDRNGGHVEGVGA